MAPDDADLDIYPTTTLFSTLQIENLTSSPSTFPPEIPKVVLHRPPESEQHDNYCNKIDETKIDSSFLAAPRLDSHSRAVTEPTQRPQPNSYPIQIDRLDCHDFDLRHQDKITHFTYINRKSANIVRKMFPNMRFGKKKQTVNHKPNSLVFRIGQKLGIAPPPTPPMSASDERFLRNIRTQFQDLSELPEDELPDTRKELEILTNWHLGELARLKRGLEAQNRIILEDRDEQRVNKSQPTTLVKGKLIHDAYIGNLRFYREWQKGIVYYHLMQLERIKTKKVLSDMEKGFGTRMLDMFVNTELADELA